MKLDKKNDLKRWWYLPFLTYIVPSILMVLFIFIFDLLVVDDVPLPLTATNFQIIVSFALVVTSFYYIKFLSLHFNSIALKYKPSKPSKYLGILIFFLQGFQLLILLLFDFGRVGGVSSSSNPLVIIASYLPTDILFLTYYAHYRNKGVPYFNLSLYIATGVLQGWTGIWMILLFIEFYYQLRSRPFKVVAGWGTLAIIILLSLYPLINKYKYILRGGEDFQQKTVVESAGQLLTRLQHVSNVILIYQERDQILLAQNRNEIIPFYLDNRLGLIFSYSSNRTNIQKYLTTNYLIDRSLFNESTNIDELGWFTNVGIAGWFLILSPIQIFFYVLFVILLTSLPFLINHYFLKSIEIIPVLQTLTLAYAFAGWFSVQFSFISGILIYVILYNAFRKRIHNK